MELTKIQKRMLLFLFGCIGTRGLLAYYAKNGSIMVQTLISYFTLIAGLGFLVIYFGDYRKVGLETQGQPIWWNHLRPIHALLYLIYFYSIQVGDYSNAWNYLMYDVVLGLLSFIIFHYKMGNFSKIL